MNLSQQIRSLVAHSRHLLPEATFEKLSSPEKKKAADTADDDLSFRVGLTVRLLQSLSLDTKNGFERKETGENVWMMVRFHTVSNPIMGNFGMYFVLPIGDPMVKKIDEAVKANCASKMYKAAMMYRRLQPRIITAVGKARRRGERAYDKCLTEPKFKDLADEALDLASKSRIITLNTRLQSLSHTACPGIANKGWTLFMADFLAENL